MNFNISRINTEQGILKLSGQFLNKKIKIETLFMMGTDGWFELDIKQDNVKILIKKVDSVLLQHLV